MKKTNVFVFLLRNTISRRLLVQLLLLTAVIVVLTFAFPLTILQIYDRVIENSSYATLLWLTIGCSIALCISAVLEFGQNKISSWTALRFIRKRDRQLVDTILFSDSEKIKEKGKQWYLEGLRSLTTTVNLIIMKFIPVLVQTPFVLVYLFVIMFIGKQLVLVPLIAFLLEIVISFLLKKAVAEKSFIKGSTEKARFDYLSYALSRITFVKAQSFEPCIVKGFDSIQSDSQCARSTQLEFFNKMNFMENIFSYIVVFGIICFGGVLVSSGLLTVGSVSACLFFSIRVELIARDISKAVFSASEISRSIHDLEQLLIDPLHGKKYRAALPVSVSGRLEFSSVVVVEKTDTAEPQVLSFILQSGETALINTTDNTYFQHQRASNICKLAAGILLPGEGEIFVDAYPSSEWMFTANSGTVAYISDRNSVLPGTILENISAFDSEKVYAALDVASFFSFDVTVSRLPLGFETVIQKNKPAGLSRSDLRLICIIRALCIRPRVIIWDTADADLEKDQIEIVYKIFTKLKGITTILLHTEDPLLASLITSGKKGGMVI